MRNISLSKNSWIFKLQRIAYGYKEYELEQDGCKLGWQLIFLPVIIVLGWPMLLINKFTDERQNGVTNAFFGVIAQLLSLFTGGGIYLNFFLNDGQDIPSSFWFYPLIMLIGLVALILFICALSGIFYVLGTAMEFIRSKRGKTNKKSFIKDWIEAKKEKSCPKINWHE